MDQIEQTSGRASAEPIQTASIPVQDTSGRRAPVLIRRAELFLRVRDYAEAAAEVPRIVGRFDAYLAGEQEYRHSYRVSNTYTIRVASAQFDSLLAALDTLAVAVEQRTINVDDVTEEFVDAEARLRARRAVEAQYLQLLGRANDVEDVLAFQSQLAQVREEIERAEGRLRFLQNRVAMSTISLTIFDESPAGFASGPGFLRRIGDAFAGGWDTLLESVVVVVALWPLWLLVALVLLARRLWRQRNPAGNPATPRRAAKAE